MMEELARLNTQWAADGLPTLDTMRTLGALATQVGAQAREYVSPAPATPALVMAGSIAVWAAVFSCYALAFRAQSPLLSLVPPIALVVFADSVLDDFERPLYGVLFLLGLPFTFLRVRTLLPLTVAWVALAPLLPGLSDDPALLAEVVREARTAGATGIWANVLYLRPGTREHFLEALARDWPELLPEYERLYAGRSYLSSSETEPVRQAVRELARASWQPRRPTIQPEPEPKQLALAV